MAANRQREWAASGGLKVNAAMREVEKQNSQFAGVLPNTFNLITGIRHGGNVDRYYDDPHHAASQFDFVLANPPFNVNAVDTERLKDMVGTGRRFPFGLPRTDNANYLWIQLDDLRIAQPPHALFDQFAAVVSPSFQLTYKLHLLIQNLRRTCDLLLPRLLSG